MGDATQSPRDAPGRETAIEVAAVVLAAGAGSRFGGAKQRLFLPAVLRAVAASGISDVVVVSGAHALEVEGARLVDCPDWRLGPGASLRAGLASLGAEADAAVVVLADGPNLRPAAIDRVLAVAHDVPAGHVVAASYDGARSHPVLVPRAMWNAIPDEGARALPAALVDCRDIDPPGDVDLADSNGRAPKPSAES